MSLRLNLTVGGLPSGHNGTPAAELRLPGLPGATSAPTSWAAGSTAQHPPIRTGAPETGATPPNPRQHAPGDPPSRTPSSAPSGGPSAGSVSSAGSGGGGGSSAGPMAMVLFAELGLATWALYVLLISAARWRSLTFTWLPERPG